MQMICGAFYISKEKKGKSQGDDAHFICRQKQTIGVADGVRAWGKKGVDAGEFARNFMSNSLNAIQRRDHKEDIDPLTILQEAYSKTNVQGSSTACILTLRDNNLHVANVGDSGFLLIRDGEDAYKSPIQQHRFNVPYQLGKSRGCDQPSSAQVSKHELRTGNIVVVGTDGLFDNMFPEQIESIAKMVKQNGEEPEQAAWAIAEQAYYNSMDQLIPTPYSQAKMHHGGHGLGGKRDDITVIVAYILD